VLLVWSTSLLLALAASVYAAAADNWESGKQAFVEGDYVAALNFFELARDEGLDGPAVHYNIAVSRFKLGHYDAAGQTFALIARRFPQMRGLAEYNLGLVASRLDDAAAARAHFLRAYELSPDDPTMRVLSSRRLRELEPEVRTASRRSGAFGARAGNDDNVALLDDTGLPQGTSAESPMVEVFGAIRGPWNGLGGFGLDASAYWVKYFDADDFDQSEIRGGIFYDWRPNDWRIHFGIHASAGTLGGDSFDRKVGGGVRLVRSIGESAAIDVRYSYDDVADSNSQFAGIDGSRQQIDARYRWYRDGHRVQLRYQLEKNDRLDPGVSPDRNRIALDYRFQPEVGIGYEAGIDLRNSDYDDLAIPRDEDLVTFRAALTYMLRSNWLLMLEYRGSDNDSTDDTFSYDRTQITLGAMKFF
jgi:hypothetical protein